MFEVRPAKQFLDRPEAGIESIMADGDSSKNAHEIDSLAGRRGDGKGQSI